MILAQNIFLLVSGLAFGALLVLVIVPVWLLFIRHWLQAFFAGCPISFFQLLGMAFRKINPGNVIPLGIAASQAGYSVGWDKLERAYLQGVDLQKVMMGYITAKKRGDDFSFEELVDAERDDKLEAMLLQSRTL